MRARRRGVRAMVICVVVLGSLVPEWAGAQAIAEAASEEAAPEEAAPEEAARFEMSTGFGVQLGFGGLGGSLGGNGLVALVPAHTDLGIPLGSRALLTVGVDLVASSSASLEYLAVSLPLGVLVYLDAPRAGAVVPLVRAALIGTMSAMHGDSALLGAGYYGLGALVRGGLTWFPIEMLGLRAELGVRGDVWGGQNYVAMALRGDGALSLVLRF